MDFDRELLVKAFRVLKPEYTKILLANLGNDTFMPVVVDGEEWRCWKSKGCSLSAWLRCFAACGVLFPGDVDKFSAFANVERLKAGFDVDRAAKVLVYRRKSADGLFRWSILRVQPAAEYTAERPEVFFYVKDINQVYQAEYDKVVDEIGSRDLFTGLLNKFAFERDKAIPGIGHIGVVYVDVNGLKYVNDTFGHDAGDKLITNTVEVLKRCFDGYSIYRVGGDEFVVFGRTINTRQFALSCNALIKAVEDADFPLCSYGIAFGKAHEINDVLSDAEKNMYISKDIFKQKYPHLAR